MGTAKGGVAGTSVPRLIDKDFFCEAFLSSRKAVVLDSMDVRQLNQSLQREAGDLLRESALDSILSQFGRVDYCGSYVYGTMVDRDIDIAVIVTNPSSINVGQRRLLLQELEKLPYCIEVKVTDRKETPKEGRPLGIWFNPRLDYRGNRWNIDISGSLPKKNRSVTTIWLYTGK